MLVRVRVAKLGIPGGLEQLLEEYTNTNWELLEAAEDSKLDSYHIHIHISYLVEMPMALKKQREKKTLTNLNHI